MAQELTLPALTMAVKNPKVDVWSIRVEWTDEQGRTCSNYIGIWDSEEKANTALVPYLKLKEAVW